MQQQPKSICLKSINIKGEEDEVEKVGRKEEEEEEGKKRRASGDGRSGGRRI